MSVISGFSRASGGFISKVALVENHVTRGIGVTRDHRRDACTEFFIKRK